MMLNYEDARALVFQNIKPLGKCTRSLTESQGLALSDDILAPHGMPSFDNSGVDGYAVQADDLAQASAEIRYCLKIWGISLQENREMIKCIPGNACRSRQAHPFQRDQILW